MNPYLDHLLRTKKSRNSQSFKCKLVEAYRAERVQASELEDKPGISRTELRRLNRWYYRVRLHPFYPLNITVRRCGRRAMKRDANNGKMLERKLADTEKENQFLRLQAEAYQTVIQIAEEHGVARAVSYPYRKKAWPHQRTGQAVEKLTRRYPLVGMELLCKLFRGRPRGPSASSLVGGYQTTGKNEFSD